MGAHASTRNFHVPLSSSLYEELREQSARLGRPATELAREAIGSWLRLQRKAALEQAIRNYAQTHAGSDADLDAELESASVEHLLSEEQN